MVEIRNFKREYVRLQSNLGLEITKDWNHYFQIRPERLEYIYSAPTFDPDTRFYAFDGGKLVGFISSAVDGEKNGIISSTTQYPIVNPEYPEAEELLMKKMFDTLRSKGAETVRTRLGHDYSNIRPLRDFLSKYGFEFESHHFDCRTRIYSNSIDTSKTNLETKIEPFVHDRDLDSIQDLYLGTEGRDDYLKNAQRMWEEFRSGHTNLVVRANAKVVAQAALYWEINNPGAAVLDHIRLASGAKPEIRESLFMRFIRIAQNKGIPEVLLYVPSVVEEPEELYSFAGLKFTRYAWYSKKL